MVTLTERAPAKVNLTLKVHGRRADGFHALESLVVFADCADVVTLDPEAPVGLIVGGPFASGLTGDNLIHRLLAMLAAEPLAKQGQLRLGQFTLTKQLPVAAGIGGGSADVAAAIRLVQRANPHMAGRIGWLKIAAQLGSDVPACLAALPCVMSGTGTAVTLLPGPLPALSLLLVNPQVAVPADKSSVVFRALGAPLLRAEPPPPTLPPVTNTVALLAYVRATGNALTAAATQVCPAITAVLAALRAQPACQYAALSGAGPTCYALFATTAGCATAAATLRGVHPGWWIEPTHIHAGTRVGTAIP